MQAEEAPDQLSRGVDQMIPNKKNTKNVKELRIIALLEARFNSSNKQVGQEILKQAKELLLVPSKAYGSRKLHRAIDCALNKILTNNIIWQLKLTAALTGIDAKSCYDRIALAVASLALQRLGVHINACKVMFGTLAQMKLHVKTAFGISKKTYYAIRTPFKVFYKETEVDHRFGW